MYQAGETVRQDDGREPPTRYKRADICKPDQLGNMIGTRVRGQALTIWSLFILVIF